MHRIFENSTKLAWCNSCSCFVNAITGYSSCRWFLRLWNVKLRTFQSVVLGISSSLLKLLDFIQTLSKYAACHPHKFVIYLHISYKNTFCIFNGFSGFSLYREPCFSNTINFILFTRFHILFLGGAYLRNFCWSFSTHIFIIFYKLLIKKFLYL